MLRIEIIKDGIMTHGGNFETQEDIDAWVLENEEFFPESYTSNTFNLTEVLLANKEKVDAISYLNSTDWYVLRFIENETAIPEEILTLRAAARLKA